MKYINKILLIAGNKEKSIVTRNDKKLVTRGWLGNLFPVENIAGLENDTIGLEYDENEGFTTSEFVPELDEDTANEITEESAKVWLEAA